MANIHSGYGPGNALTTRADPPAGEGMAQLQALIGDRKSDYDERRANRGNERPRGTGAASYGASRAIERPRGTPDQLGSAQNMPNRYADDFEGSFGTLEGGGLGRVGGAYMPYNGGPASANTIVATGFRRPGTGMQAPKESGFVPSGPPRPVGNEALYDRNQAALLDPWGIS